MDQYSSVPIINGLSDLSHPCQTLATLMTIIEVKGTLKNINISWFGPISNVAHSLIDAANHNLGFNLNIYCDAPTGSGLGTSGCLGSMLVKLMAHFKKIKISNNKAGKIALEIERDLIKWRFINI